jgi:hypothetical protein
MSGNIKKSWVCYHQLNIYKKNGREGMRIGVWRGEYILVYGCS